MKIEANFDTSYDMTQRNIRQPRTKTQNKEEPARTRALATNDFSWNFPNMYEPVFGSCQSFCLVIVSYLHELERLETKKKNVPPKHGSSYTLRCYK